MNELNEKGGGVRLAGVTREAIGVVLLLGLKDDRESRECVGKRA